MSSTPSISAADHGAVAAVASGAGAAADGGTGKLISIVIPLYNEEGNVDELGRRLSMLFLAHPRYRFEVILVENGSHDRTWDKSCALNAADPRFKVLRLARNFNCEGGITAGLLQARGDAAVIMAGDLQDPPELITQFIAKWEEGYENVYQIVTRRASSTWIRSKVSELFYLILNRITDGMMPRNVSDFRLVDRKVYQAVNSMEERNRFVRGLFAWVGFSTIGVPCDRPPRHAGESKAYTFMVIALALRGIFSHTYLPLKIIQFMGIGVSAFSFLMLGLTVYKIFAFGVPFDGFGTLMSIMLLMFGCLFTFLGIMGEYIGLIYEEVKQRPNFLVKDNRGLSGHGNGVE